MKNPQTLNRRRPRILLVVPEARRWVHACHYGYQCSYGLEEGFQSLGIEFTTLVAPSAHEVDATSPLSWLRYRQELLKEKVFDQVWIEICHSRLNEDFLTWMADNIPVRLGFMPESMEFDPGELVNNPQGAGRRVENLTKHLKYVTHIAAVDEIDVEAFNTHAQIPALWWAGGAIPNRFIDRTPLPPRYEAAVFYGSMYGVRGQWLRDPRLAGLIVQPIDTPEARSDCPMQFDAASLCSEEYLAQSQPFSMARYRDYLDAVRKIRGEGFGLWLSALQLGGAVINLPQFGRAYSSRVVEAMAAGRPVISWEIDARPRTSKLFVSGEEILLFSKTNPDELAEHIRHLQRDPQFALRIAENARRKMLKEHTTEIFVQRLVEWLPEVKIEATSKKIKAHSATKNYSDGSVALGKNVRPQIQPGTNLLAELLEKNLCRSGRPLRLHLGCGENHFDDYVNIDYPPSEHTAQTVIGADIFADITQLVLPPQCVDEIRMHHVFEHFSRPHALALLISWHECLKIGGQLRLETPDVMGCAEQLVSNASYRVKQAVLRHCFGSQEAHWANHYDGWHAEKYQRTLEKLGFTVECRRWSWGREPWLANVEAVAKKQRHMTREELLLAADTILEDFMVFEVASERTIWNVWREAMRARLIAPQTISEIVAELPAIPSPTTPLLNSLLTQAEGEYAHEQWQSARGFLCLATIIAPEHPQILPALGNLHFKLKEYDAAIKAFTAAVRVTPDNPDLHTQLAMCRLELNQLQEAEAALRQALALRQGDVTALKLLADCYLAGALYEEAAKIYAKLIDHHPDQVGVFLSLAKCFFGLRDFDGAQAASEHALRIEPTNVMALENLAFLRKQNPDSSPAPIQGLIFSKDRALQLDATLTSFKARCRDFHLVDLWVLYTASDSRFEEQYRQLVIDHPTVNFNREKQFASDVRSIVGASSHVLFLVDDNLFVRDFSLADAIESLEKNPTALGFSLRLGRNTTHCYPVNRTQSLPEFQAIAPGVLNFDWTKADLDFAYPLEVSSSLYRTQDLVPILSRIDFNSPNVLESQLAEKVEVFRTSHRHLLCFEQSVTFCNPLNKVQNVYTHNRAGALSENTVAVLADKFDAGWRVEVATLVGYLPHGCHEEAALELKRVRVPMVAVPVVSVIILCHNYAAHLPVAVGSVLAQTYTNYEVIIIDDGSTDDSLKIAQRLADENRKRIPIRVFHLDDVGPSAARHFGVAQTHGRFLVPLDADDKLAPEFLAKTVPVLEAKKELGFAYVDTETFGDLVHRHFQPDYDFPRLCVGNYISYCSLIRRTAFEAVGGYDRANWGYFEDWDLWIRLGHAGWFGQHVPELLFYYQQHFNSSLSFYSLRLTQVYQSYIVGHRPELYSPETVANAKQILAEMPAGWHAQPPLKDVASIQKRLAQNPGNRHLQYFLAMAHARSGHFRAAVAVLTGLLTVHPGDDQARKALEQFRADAVRELESATPNEPASTPVANQPGEGNDLEGLKARVREYLAQEKWSEAVETCAKVVVLAADDTENLFMFAHALANLGAVGDALKIAQHLVVLKPDESEYSNLAGILERAVVGTVAPETPVFGSSVAEPGVARTKLLAGKFDTDKGQGFLDQYERYFGHLVDQEVKLLEIGVFRGGSLLMWQDYFKKGQITGLDLNPVSLKEKAERIRIYQGYQQDGSLLGRIRNERAPEGFDIIIDDASHLGNLTRETFNHLFDRHLKPGGIYVIEDWGTGYWEAFPDGKKFVQDVPHHAGMVGFIKELVDEAGMDDLSKVSRGGVGPSRESKFEGVLVTDGQVFIVKKKAPVATIAERQDSPAPKKLVAGKFDTDKGQDFLDQYEHHFGRLVAEGVRLLEIGVFRGGSLLMWQDYFKKGQITGLDLNPVLLKEEAERIRIYQGYQQDGVLLGRIRNERAPEGFDIIIDDASHLGNLTRETFNHLFDQHLKPGGIYVIEDWGTGYWDTFPDGKKFVQGVPHDAGMVGFIKELVDEAGMGDVTKTGHGGVSPARESKFEGVYITGGQVFITKKQVQGKRPSVAAGLAQSITNPQAVATSASVVEQKVAPRAVKSVVPAPQRVIALVSAYNEGDVIYHVVGDLIANGVEVYFIDNNSTDNTIAEASKWLGKGLLKIERFPQDAGPEYSQRCEKEYVWSQILRRKEELAAQLGADWYIHADADEFRESPWPGKTLSEAIAEVDAHGYNAINFELLNFRPTDDGFIPGTDVRQHLIAYDPAEFFDVLQIKAWKNPGQRVQIVSNGGHSIDIPGRRVFPINFILRHYPIRGETHGRRKVFKDRVPRFAKEEVAWKWHVQYNCYVDGSTEFLHAPEKLKPYDGAAFRAQLLADYADDEKLVTTLGGQPGGTGTPNPEALCAWVGRELAMPGPLALEIGQQAEQVLGQLLATLAGGKKDLGLELEPASANLLRILLKGKIAFARFAGDVRLVQTGATLNGLLTAALTAPQAVAVTDSEAQPVGTLPLVSVCIPTFNAQDFIAAAVSCVLAQDYPNIELIISDDSSADHTIEIIEKSLVAAKIPVAILKHPRLGLVENWNYCLQQAKGKYIKFLFQDDLLEPNCVGELVRLAERDSEIGLVFSPRQIERRGPAAASAALDAAYRDGLDVHKGWTHLVAVQSGTALLRDPKLFQNPINKVGEPTTVLLSKAAIEAVGGFDPNLRQLVDVEMWLRIMTKYKVGFVDRVLSRFRLHDKQATQANLKAGLIAEDWKRFYGKLATDPLFACLSTAHRSHASKMFTQLGGVVASAEPSDEIFAPDEVQSFEQLATAYSNNPADAGVSGQLRELQQGVMNFLVTAEFEKLEGHFKGSLGRVFRALVKSGLPSEAPTEESQAQLAILDEALAGPEAADGSFDYRPLFARMLCGPAHRGTLTVAPGRIPAWFLNDYLAYVLHAPQVFVAEGEAEQYKNYSMGLVRSISQRIGAAPKEKLTLEVASYFALRANYIPLYFANSNTRELAEKRAEIMEFVLAKNGAVIDYTPPKRSKNQKKIKVGYLSAHFGAQTETHVTLPTLQLDRTKFEVCLFAVEVNPGPVEDRCRGFSDTFTRLPKQTQEQVAVIRNAKLDVLIIGTNVTAVTNQVSLLALHRLAPVQLVSYCSPVSTGMRHVDGYLTGSHMDFPGIQEHFSEKLMVCDGPPGCLDYTVETKGSGARFTREGLGLAADDVIFINAAACFKILPEMQETWAKILKAVPKSRLLLLPFNPNWSNAFPVKQFERTLTEACARQGLGRDSFVLANSLPSRADVKELEKLADVYLDTFPFSGSISVIDPLELGIPAVVWEGKTPRSRMASALLRELGVTELITQDEESYIRLSIKLATEPAYRRQISERIAAAMALRPRFTDAKAYAQGLGNVIESLVVTSPRPELAAAAAV